MLKLRGEKVGKSNDTKKNEKEKIKTDYIRVDGCWIDECKDYRKSGVTRNAVTSNGNEGEKKEEEESGKKPKKKNEIDIAKQNPKRNSQLDGLWKWTGHTRTLMLPESVGNWKGAWLADAPHEPSITKIQSASRQKGGENAGKKKEEDPTTELRTFRTSRQRW